MNGWRLFLFLAPKPCNLIKEGKRLLLWLLSFTAGPFPKFTATRINNEAKIKKSLKCKPQNQHKWCSYYPNTLDIPVSDYLSKSVGNNERHMVPSAEVAWKYSIFKMATPLPSCRKVEMGSVMQFLMQKKFNLLKFIVECLLIDQN